MSTRAELDELFLEAAQQQVEQLVQQTVATQRLANAAERLADLADLARDALDRDSDGRRYTADRVREALELAATGTDREFVLDLLCYGDPQLELGNEARRRQRAATLVAAARNGKPGDAADLLRQLADALADAIAP